ncbi:hypothetical protein ACPPVO_01525 [Dactylosporangium sp. McL0621]|uniref:hypothetical protein n=1 Tax=Dactylosporangium sp. McL0621 TaxID=3415678 RepID=UPI003CFAD175
MLFNPVANISGAHDLRIIAGDAAVGQAFCDPLTFGGPRFATPARELLRLVWPSTATQARLMWGARIAARARQHPVDELLPEAVADLMGVPAPVLRSIEAQCRDLVDPLAPMRLLDDAIAGVVRDRGVGRPETVLDELLFWRGLGPERIALDEVAELVTALTAALWDAATMVLPGLLDAALSYPGADRARLVELVLSSGPGVVGWLRETSQAVMLDGDLVPAGERCLLLVDATERRTREPLRTLRWLAPDCPTGAGATFARLFANALPALPSEVMPLPTRQPRRLQLLLHAAGSNGYLAHARRSRRG